MRHLPEEIRKKFIFTVMELCTKTLKFNLKLNSTEIQTDDKEPDHDFICKLISEHFSQKLLSTLDEILTYRKKKDAVLSDSDSDEDRE